MGRVSRMIIGQCGAPVLLSILLASCSGGSGSSGTGNPVVAAAGGNGPGNQLSDDAKSIDLPTALREIAALETPADVDAAVFEELKAELGRLLADSDHFKAISAEEDLSFQTRNFFVPDAYSLHIDARHTKLNWLYRMNGDYDQNGSVNAADLIPLAANLGHSAHGEGQAGRFATGSLDFVVDGNMDGLLGLADITPIAQNFGNAFREFNVYGTDDLSDYPWHSLKPDGGTQFLQDLGVAPVAGLGLSEALLLPEGQKYYEYQLPNVPRNYYWVSFTSSLSKDLHTDIALPGELLDPRPLNYLLPYRETGTLPYFDPERNELVFYSVYGADGNHNRSISVSDITPIGMYLGKSVGDPFGNPNTRLADYNRDGIVTVNDAILIHLMLYASYEGYHVYYADDASALPDGYWAEEPNSPLPDSILTPNWLSYTEISAELPFTPASGSYLYLRPYLGEELGPVCEFVQVP